MSDRREGPDRPSVLVTGAAGYLGTLTVRALSDRREQLGGIIALDVKPVPPSSRKKGVAYVQASVTDDALAGILREHAVDTVVHLASILRPPAVDGDAVARRVDVDGTRNVLAACVSAGVKQLVVTTSGAAYGYHANSPACITESDAIRGNEEFVYSRNKRLVEQMLADHRERHPELRQLVFRPGTVLGETVSSPVTDLFEKRIVVGVAGSASPFVFVWDRDVVAYILTGILERREGVYNLAGDGAMTLRDIARRLGKPFVPVPAPLLRAALVVAQALGATRYGPEQVSFLRYRPVLSNRRLKADFHPAPRTSRRAFEEYVRARRRARS